MGISTIASVPCPYVPLCVFIAKSGFYILMANRARLATSKHMHTTSPFVATAIANFRFPQLKLSTIL
jgi:hypothetical protein